ncbi:MAG: hypothetical protein NUW12_01605 [Firmicutes bacterium]|jgi:hypothetical protein|nr:hypothetical protein [Bacillota bacterium]MDH7494860.1 hypothetical protein [Bacillota bacterium]
MKSAYWQLLSKEVRSSKLAMLLSVSVIVAWDIFLATRLAKWQEALVAGFAWMPLGIMYLYALFSGTASFSQEWHGNHMHLMLSLPVRGWQIFSAKALSTLCEAVVITIVTMGGASLLGFGPTVALFRSGGGVPSAVPASLVYRLVALGIVLLWLSVIAVVIMAQFSYVAGRMFQRFGGLVMVWTLLLSFWGLLRFMSIVTPAFRWLPDLPFQVWNNVNGFVRLVTVHLDSAPLAAAALWILILFWVGSWLLERHVEV